MAIPGAILLAVQTLSVPQAGHDVVITTHEDSPALPHWITDRVTCGDDVLEIRTGWSGKPTDEQWGWTVSLNGKTLADPYRASGLTTLAKPGVDRYSIRCRYRRGFYVIIYHAERGGAAPPVFSVQSLTIDVQGEIKARSEQPATMDNYLWR